jgi:hypothetical protein
MQWCATYLCNSWTILMPSMAGWDMIAWRGCTRRPISPHTHTHTHAQRPKRPDPGTRANMRHSIKKKDSIYHVLCIFVNVDGKYNLLVDATAPTHARTHLFRYHEWRIEVVIRDRTDGVGTSQTAQQQIHRHQARTQPHPTLTAAGDMQYSMASMWNIVSKQVERK